ncbi:pyridoxal phosphate-dependent aminotransferase [Candidatus Woesearchaeota archaeon]|nr:pyridoxal phosphate-dependent aminotransferase [Candidatus Woesearchaeota archaeon]
MQDYQKSNVSQRASQISPSLTLSLSAKAANLKKQGLPVISFTAGEPDFDTPEHIKDAAKLALDKGLTKYTNNSGIPELKQAICKKLKEENNIDYSSDEIIVSCGGKHSLTNIFLATINEGDEVILPAPYWVSYEEQIKLSQGKVVLAHLPELKFSADLIAEKLTAKTKMIVLNSPSNPTGAVITRKELKKLADIAIEKNVLILSDEVYEHFIYDNDDEHKFRSIASLGEEIKKLTITMNSFSKTYAMTGWRLGYCAAEKRIINAMDALQSHMTSNPTTFAQHGAVAALTMKDKSAVFVNNMNKEFKKRRDLMVKRLQESENIECTMPSGAFYAFPKISNCKLNDKHLNGIKLSELLLEKETVAVVPGIAFGDDNYIRLSYATSMEQIEQGMDRIEKFCRENLAR